MLDLSQKDKGQPDSDFWAWKPVTAGILFNPVKPIIAAKLSTFALGVPPVVLFLSLTPRGATICPQLAFCDW